MGENMLAEKYVEKLQPFKINTHDQTIAVMPLLY
jgi:hypothetical protein